MDDVRNDDRLTTADIANPIPVRDVRTGTDETRRDARGTTSLRESFRNDQVEARDEPVRTGVVPNEPVATNDVRDVRDDNLRTADVAAQARAAEQGTQSAVSTEQQQRQTPLFPDDELHNFRARWDQVQTSFVDEPRQAVEQADSLVANVVKRIAEQFAGERAELEKQWDRGDNVSTEDLRQGLRRYRAFFDRLLSV